MSDLIKGATVSVLKTGTYFGPKGSERMIRGEEVQVERVFKDGSIRAHSTWLGSARSVTMHAGDFSEPLRPLGQVPEGGISADDPRLDWLWEDAERVAKMSGFCSEYDKLLKTLNLPGRLRTHTVKMASADGIEIVARVKARSLRQAEARLREQINARAVGGMSVDGQGAEVVLATLEETR